MSFWSVVTSQILSVHDTNPDSRKSTLFTLLFLKIRRTLGFETFINLLITLRPEGEGRVLFNSRVQRRDTL